MAPGSVMGWGLCYCCFDANIAGPAMIKSPPILLESTLTFSIPRAVYNSVE